MLLSKAIDIYILLTRQSIAYRNIQLTETEFMTSCILESTNDTHTATKLNV